MRQNPGLSKQTLDLVPLSHKLITIGYSTCSFILTAYERNYLAWIKLVVACLVISGGLIIRLHVS